MFESVKGVARSASRSYVRSMSDPNDPSPAPDDVTAAVQPESAAESDEFTEITPPTGPADDDDLAREEGER